MEVGYQHANPHDGRESTLLRFHDDVRDQTTCVLVDAGAGVDLDAILADDEYLSAVLLTHAHLDHFRTLGENVRDGAPIYATPETVRSIETRLDTDAEHATITNGEAVRDALEPITDWTTITSDVRVHPVPAGHAPGACGFVLQFADGDDRHHLLATGDFTSRRAAGYPGLPTDLPVDAVFLTAATSEDFEDTLTDAMATVIERAIAGSTVLTTASGSTGVHLAYLLANVGRREGPSLPVTVAGRVATLWDAIEYEHPAVESVPTFRDPTDVLEPGRITIAGPEVPVAGSSERLFEAIADDGGATLVQVTSGAFEPERSASCTVDHYELSNHPDEETIDGVVEVLAPVHVVVTHQQGRAANRYKDKYDSFVWATDDRARYTLYEDGEWAGPPWVTEATRRRVRSRLYRSGGAGIETRFEDADVPLPTVERHEDVDLAAEGLDVDRLADQTGIDVSTLEAPAVGDRTAVETADGKPPTDDAVAVADGSTVQDDRDDDPAETADRAAEGSVAGRRDDGDPSTADGAATGTDATLTEIVDRLDRLEAAVGGIHARATVVDAGDDVTLLRLADEAAVDELTHGQSVDLTIRDDPHPADDDPD